MNETLESLLEMICKTTVRAQQNDKQTLYLLTDPKDARLAYDILVGIGLEAKFFAEDDIAKLYVQNASVAACEEKLVQAKTTTPFFKSVKDLVDDQENFSNYTLSLTNTANGRQLTLLLPADKPSKQPKTAAAATSTAAPAPKRTASATRTSKPSEEESILTGPAVARAALPKQFQTSATEEDPLSKRIMFYLSGKAFTSGAWGMFVLLILGVVFSILVTIRGFLCPDVATDQRNVPAYCPGSKSVEKE